MSEASAAEYISPYEYIQEKVLPTRREKREQRTALQWWIHTRPCEGMRRSISGLPRFVSTPTLAKHRIFVWLQHPVLPDHQLVVIARDDDYFFGALHSRPHELWSLRMGTSLEDRPRYTPTTTFQTYPFPWPPGQESQDDPRVQAIAEAAKELVEQRDGWLNPPGLDEKALQKCTLTNLYNERPPWLDAAHKKLDAAVFDAYGWPADLSDEEILARLLALNLARAQGRAAAGEE